MTVTVAGLAAWLLGFALLPAPLPARILLLAPLVVVPRLLGRIPERPLPFVLSLRRLSRWPAFVAALPLLPAFALSPSVAATALTLPWLALTAAGLVAALAHALPRLPSLLHPARAADLAVDAALGYLSVGALFLAADRIGLRPLDFPALIILLTAVHFHFAGFGLLTVAGLTAAGGGPVSRAGALALVLGMPLTAAGFTFDSPAVNVLGAVVVGLGASAVGARLLLAAAHRAGFPRLAASLGALALLVGVPLGVVWAFAEMLQAPFVDLDSMVRVHGGLNAAGVVLASFGPAGEGGS